MSPNQNEKRLYDSKVRQFLTKDEGSVKAVARYIDLESNGYGDASLHIGDSYISASIWPSSQYYGPTHGHSLDDAIADAEALRDFIGDFIEEAKAVKVIVEDPKMIAKWQASEPAPDPGVPETSEL